jgi:type VI secretion system protein ImpF
MQRLNPTLFDKLVAHLELGGLRSREGETSNAVNDVVQRGLLHYDLANVDRFTEAGLRGNVRRELAWLMNTTNFESGQDLAAFPNVRTSVLNYGVADLTGKAQSRESIQARAARIKQAILAFEPRLDAASLSIEVRPTLERENAVTFVISGDITAAVQALKVRYVADIEVDTGAASVRD